MRIRRSFRPHYACSLDKNIKQRCSYTRYGNNDRTSHTSVDTACWTLRFLPSLLPINIKKRFGHLGPSKYNNMATNTDDICEKYSFIHYWPWFALHQQGSLWDLHEALWCTGCASCYSYSYSSCQLCISPRSVCSVTADAIVNALFVCPCRRWENNNIIFYILLDMLLCFL